MIIHVGLNDTDTPTSEGTNQVARRIEGRVTRRTVPIDDLAGPSLLQ